MNRYKITASSFLMSLLSFNVAYAQNFICLGEKAAVLSSSKKGFFESATGNPEVFKFIYRDGISVKSVGKADFNTECKDDGTCSYSLSNIWNRFEYYDFNNQFTFSISIQRPNLNVDYWIVGGTCSEIDLD